MDLLSKDSYDQIVISICCYGARKSIYFSEKFDYIFYRIIEHGASTTLKNGPTAVQTSENAKKKKFNIREGVIESMK